MTKRRIRIFGIDPQVDFCDLPDDLLPVVGGQKVLPALPVKGAHDDMLRAAEMINVGEAGIDGIVVAMDSHNFVGIERSTFWRCAEKDATCPGWEFPVSGVVSVGDVESGRVMPRNAANVERALAYLRALEAVGKVLYVWPVHCEVGTWGHQIHPDLLQGLHRWESFSQRQTRKEFKGLNPWTEHYSVFRADVVDPSDPHTDLNMDLLRALSEGTDQLAVFGEAGSHCVRASMEDLVGYTPQDFWSRIVLLTDAMSPVPGFEADQAQFLGRMAGLGVQFATCEDFTKELLANANR